MLLVGMVHDIGNLVGRKGHSKYSLDILRELFANRQGHEQQWLAVEQAVLAHDEPVLSGGEMVLKDGWPLLWAIVIADKMHVGRNRIGEKSLKTAPDGSLEMDPHVVMDCLLTGSTWYLAGDTFTWRLDFSTEQLEEKFLTVTRNKDRVWVPAEYQKAFRERGVRYRETFAQQFLEVKKERVKLAAEAALLLFPWISDFQVLLSDSDSRGKVERAEMVIHRVVRSQEKGS
jgi:hypothetical protein